MTGQDIHAALVKAMDEVQMPPGIRDWNDIIPKEQAIFDRAADLLTANPAG
jgi:hypothetical protein